jgi:uncharacterized caspase-like protein
MTNAVMALAALVSGPSPRNLSAMMLNRLAYALCSTAFLALPAGAEVRAVLVGVSDYLYLDADLKGPGNDVRLMAETLAARGIAPAGMTILTSDPTGLPQGAATGAPTRDGILTALTDVAAKAAPGDTVVFYFSGHGGQAPDLSGDEGGGYDEIFLPADATGWKGSIGAVENAILDDELQVWAQALMDRDVALVGLIDACHSATGFRGSAGKGAARGLTPDQLGVPEGTASAPATAPVDLTGNYVFLYSSQSDERSFEYPLGDTGLWQGEFTLRLTQILSAAPEASWAQVLAHVADTMLQGEARQVPEGEGPMLDAQVFGSGQAAARLQVAGAVLKAGLLQGLAEGTEVTFYAQGSGGEPLGTALVKKVSAREATLDAPAPEGAAWAEISAAPPPAPLVLAAPLRADPADGFDYAAWEAALPALGAEPDLVPILTEGTVALAGPDGLLDPEGPGSTPRIVLDEGESPAEALARALDTAAHGLRLRAALLGATGRSITGKDAVSVSYEIRPGSPEGDACGKAGAATDWDPAQGAQECDQIWLTVTNRSGKMQDVSVLYMSADFAVAPIWPQQNTVNRLAPGESARIGLQIAAGSKAGVEEIWVLAVPMGEDSGLRTDLTRLATTDTTRGGPADAMTAWLETRLADPEEQTRGFSTKPAALTMIRQRVRLNPGPDAAL